MSSMEAGKRLITAVLLSTVCVVTLYLVLSIITGDLYNDLLIPVSVTAAVFAFFGIILVGLPIHFFLVWRQLSRPLHYAIPGFSIPVVVVVMWHPFGEDGAFWISWQSILMGAFGAIVAIVFRRIALGKESAS